MKITWFRFCLINLFKTTSPPKHWTQQISPEPAPESRLSSSSPLSLLLLLLPPPAPSWSRRGKGRKRFRRIYGTADGEKDRIAILLFSDGGSKIFIRYSVDFFKPKTIKEAPFLPDWAPPRANMWEWTLKTGSLYIPGKETAHNEKGSGMIRLFRRFLYLCLEVFSFELCLPMWRSTRSIHNGGFPLRKQSCRTNLLTSLYYKYRFKFNFCNRLIFPLCVCVYPNTVYFSILIRAIIDKIYAFRVQEFHQYKIEWTGSTCATSLTRSVHQHQHQGKPPGPGLN